MHTFGLYVNTHKENWLKYSKEIISVIKSRNCIVTVDEEIADNFPELDIINYEKLDFLITLGGDGTILRVAGRCAQNNVPIFGLNLGRLGFLAEAEVSEFESCIDKIIGGGYIIDSRMMLNIEAAGKRTVAINETALLKKNISRTIELEYAIDGVIIDKILGDGMLICTPTGSTGYSLSAGGPVIEPSIDCFILTPVCAHSLYSRPLIVRDNSAIKIVHTSKNDGATLAVDGVEFAKLGFGDAVYIKKSAHRCKFLRLRDSNFYLLLKDKFS